MKLSRGVYTEIKKVRYGRKKPLMLNFLSIVTLIILLFSLVDGYTIPLKEEHVNYLNRVILILFKAKSFKLFQPDLSICLTKYILRFPNLAEQVIYFNQIKKKHSKFRILILKNT